ncbi:MAG: hypothetical protein IKZ98_00240 [Clostridia bacterium]|nr:hypothetical protein [Clostridia bacterium]
MRRKVLISGEGISLRAIHIAMIICAVVISLLLVFSTYQSANVFSTLSKAAGDYSVRQKAAHELMEASDYLTEMVQRFTLEGDTQYLENYFEEVFVSRRREESITSMSESETEKLLVAQLQEAMAESTSLSYREYYAMKLVIEAREIRDYPDTLRGVELKEEDTILSSEEKMELAREMVMGKEYYERKESIRNKLRSSLEVLDQQMTATRQNTSADLNRELTLVRVVIAILTVIIIALIWLTARLGTIPLMEAGKQAEAGDRIPVTGAKEFRRLAGKYNKMLDQLNGSKEEDQ